MKKVFYILGLITLLSVVISCSSTPENSNEDINQASEDLKKTGILPSWNEGRTKTAIINYVNDITNTEGENFIPIEDRIATFDNDGTLWSEQPAYFQLFFAMDRVKVMAKDYPEWKNKQPFKAVLEDDMEALKKSGMNGLLEIIMTTHVGVTTDEFDASVKEWIKTAKHPTKEKSYTGLVFQPMLELLEYLRANDFKTYIVSGGEVDFMRALVTEVYGIPTEQIIGTRVQTEFDYNNGNPVIKRLPALDFYDDKEGKPINIHNIIGKKPVFASGNSDGDLQMLQWTASNKLRSFMLYVHHTDSIKEWAYDRESDIGRLDKGLDEANEKGWTIIDMKKDWKVIYPFELKELEH